MTDVCIDTNVPVVSNDRDGEYDGDCVRRCIERLRRARTEDRVVLDFEGEIIEEYRRYLRSSGQPGPGDAFYFHVLQHLGDGTRTRLVELERDVHRVYARFPDDPRLGGFDRSDRKFATAAIVTEGTVINAIDSDWLDHQTPLHEHGVEVEFVCGECAATRGDP